MGNNRIVDCRESRFYRLYEFVALTLKYSYYNTSTARYLQQVDSISNGKENRWNYR